ncbi:unnamed protein product [Thelazia callipaeda]|uniref:Basement membrane-specific heparan sulfate proteoglycan core protein n=1 Tax=Thelazia callipaeda TaxID=103827 RepID=A0A0N5CJ63_THECL|nr:unnamed protein product [Thelazia callipaeda]
MKKSHEVLVRSGKRSITEGCGNSYYKCNSGDCIPLHEVCNRKYDCADGSDEMQCEYFLAAVEAHNKRKNIPVTASTKNQRNEFGRRSEKQSKKADRKISYKRESKQEGIRKSQQRHIHGNNHRKSVNHVLRAPPSYAQSRYGYLLGSGQDSHSFAKEYGGGRRYNFAYNHLSYKDRGMHIGYSDSYDRKGNRWYRNGNVRGNGNSYSAQADQYSGHQKKSTGRNGCADGYQNSYDFGYENRNNKIEDYGQNIGHTNSADCTSANNYNASEQSGRSYVKDHKYFGYGQNGRVGTKTDSKPRISGRRMENDGYNRIEGGSRNGYSSEGNRITADSRAYIVPFGKEAKLRQNDGDFAVHQNNGYSLPRQLFDGQNDFTADYASSYEQHRRPTSPIPEPQITTSSPAFINHINDLYQFEGVKEQGYDTAVAVRSKTLTSTASLIKEISNGIGIDDNDANLYDCSDQEFRCPYLETILCVHYVKLCDGFDDCGDGSDEMNCAEDDIISSSGSDGSLPKDPSRCSTTQFQCGDGKCIEKTEHCNRKYDCDDGTDETSCDYFQEALKHATTSTHTVTLHSAEPTQAQVEAYKEGGRKSDGEREEHEPEKEGEQQQEVQEERGTDEQEIEKDYNEEKKRVSEGQEQAEVEEGEERKKLREKEQEEIGREIELERQEEQKHYEEEEQKNSEKEHENYEIEKHEIYGNEEISWEEHKQREREPTEELIVRKETEKDDNELRDYTRFGESDRENEEGDERKTELEHKAEEAEKREQLEKYSMTVEGVRIRESEEHRRLNAERHDRVKPFHSGDDNNIDENNRYVEADVREQYEVLEAGRVCASNQYQCVNLECINESAQCDGKADCSDGSDEMLCHPSLQRQRVKSSSTTTLTSTATSFITFAFFIRF